MSDRCTDYLDSYPNDLLTIVTVRFREEPDEQEEEEEEEKKDEGDSEEEENDDDQDSGYSVRPGGR